MNYVSKKQAKRHMAKRKAKYVRTNSKTKIIQKTIKNRVNISGLFVIIAYKNRYRWLTMVDFIAEALKDGVVVSPYTASPTLQDLSGNTKYIAPGYRRDELLRRATQRTDVNSRTAWEYKFNDGGTMRFKGALGFTRVERISKAVFVSTKIKRT